MQYKKFYYPIERVLEDLENNIQIDYSDIKGKVHYKLLKKRVGVKPVNVVVDGIVEKQIRFISWFEITIGNEPPFEAGILANHAEYERGVYRLLNDKHSPMRMVFDD